MNAASNASTTLETFKLLIQYSGFYLNAISVDSQNVLMIYLHNKKWVNDSEPDIEVVKLFIDSGVNLNHKRATDADSEYSK